MAYIRRIGNDTDIDRLLNKTSTTAVRSGFVEIGDDNFCLPVYYEDCEEKIRKFKARDDDCFLCGHVKSGTTWAAEMIWLIVNDFDYDTALKKNIHSRFPVIEVHALLDMNTLLENQTHPVPPQLDFYEQIKSPRLFKSHLHWSLLPEEIRNGSKLPKIIVTLRNAEDTCVSLFHFSQTIEGFKGTFEDICEMFLAGRICYGPFWKQVLSYWNEKHRANLLFITYKDMKNDLPSVIKKVAIFLEKNITEEQLAELTKHLSFESMKNNPSVNNNNVIKTMKEIGMSTANNDFIRTGKVGGYKSKMSPKMIARFKDWTEKNTKDTGLMLY